MADVRDYENSTHVSQVLPGLDPEPPEGYTDRTSDSAKAAAYLDYEERSRRESARHSMEWTREMMDKESDREQARIPIERTHAVEREAEAVQRASGGTGYVKPQQTREEAKEATSPERVSAPAPEPKEADINKKPMIHSVNPQTGEEITIYSPAPKPARTKPAPQTSVKRPMIRSVNVETGEVMETAGVGQVPISKGKQTQSTTPTETSVPAVTAAAGVVGKKPPQAVVKTPASPATANVSAAAIKPMSRASATAPVSTAGASAVSPAGTMARASAKVPEVKAGRASTAASAPAASISRASAPVQGAPAGGVTKAPEKASVPARPVQAVRPVDEYGQAIDKEIHGSRVSGHIHHSAAWLAQQEREAAKQPPAIAQQAPAAAHPAHGIKAREHAAQRHAEPMSRRTKHDQVAGKAVQGHAQPAQTVSGVKDTSITPVAMAQSKVEQNAASVQGKESKSIVESGGNRLTGTAELTMNGLPVGELKLNLRRAG